MQNLMVMPASPALAEELSPSDDASRALLSAACELTRDAARVNGRAPLKVDIVGSRDARWRTEHTGSLRAWGAPQVDVGGGNYLPEIMARYVLTNALGAESSHHAFTVEDSRASLGEVRSGRFTIVCVDGSAGLTERAPLALVEGARDTHLWCESVLAGAEEDCDEELLHSTGVLETALWAQLAGVHPHHAELRAADSTLGVGRYVAGWQC
ncbi:MULTISPECIES: hypothetical protein [Corynebacterium]|uniref:Uncharacterized protein n=1 Tax=Corynebacterium aurimucosum TaxID=169292 RepID=A0A6I3K7W4_9CORY|nr:MULTISPECIES: hypothetical protein [Corynebacterium]MTD91345.1 hypothetical protein [Corynebacterium aurimucosum]OFN35071.1 hypothetical protein HMPREF2565_07975 [Corynebacterium sp. HMSC072A04]OFQ53476.1 hypothetical protein HMPREF2932_05330 [Corynebacterium sp. HMSC074H12]